MDQPKIERLLRLMKMLTANTQYTLNDLASRLEISPRSVYRYIDTFKEAGFVVHKQGEIYKLGKESPYFKDISQLIHFNEEEAFIINKLIDALDDTNILKQNLRKKLVSVYNCTSLAECVVKGKNASNVNSIVEAIENHKQVVLHNYASSHRNEISDRRVEPFAFTTNYVQIWCYDTKDQMNKLFKTERIEKVEILETDWCNESGHKEGTIDIFRMSGYDLFPAKIKLGILAHNLILEEYPLAERDLKKIDDNHWLLDTQVTSYSGITRFILGLIDDIEIVGPDKLKRHIAQYAEKYFVFLKRKMIFTKTVNSGKYLCLNKQIDHGNEKTKKR